MRASNTHPQVRSVTRAKEMDVSMMVSDVVERLNALDALLDSQERPCVFVLWGDGSWALETADGMRIAEGDSATEFIVWSKKRLEQ